MENVPASGRKIIATITLAAAIAGATGRLAVNPSVAYVLVAVFGCWAVYEFLRVRPDHPFRDGRFTFFIFILRPVQTLFAHVWLTIPYLLAGMKERHEGWPVAPLARGAAAALRSMPADHAPAFCLCTQRLYSARRMALRRDRAAKRVHMRSG